MSEAAGFTCWINGTPFSDRVETLTVGDLRRMAAVPDAHDFFVENAAWGQHRLQLLSVAGEDVKLDEEGQTIHLSVHRRFYSTPRFINAG